MENIIGKKFNHLTVLKFHHKEQVYCKNGKKNGFKYFYLCLCDCGNTCVVALNHLKYNHTQSCGCITLKHKKSYTRIFRIWSGIKTRCYNQNSSKYKYYGGKGIKLYSEWLDFKNFYAWSIPNGYADNLTIDRINVNGNYEPSNCRWVTQKIQQNNRSNNKLICYNGHFKTLKQWSEELNINYATLKSRINYGWSIENAFDTKIR